MKKILFFALLTFTLASCSKQEFCREPEVKQTSAVQFRVSVNGQESFKQVPQVTISGIIDGKSFEKKVTGNECLSEIIELQKSRNVQFNLQCNSSVTGTFQVDVIVDGDVLMSFGSSCDMYEYSRNNEMLYL